MLISSIRLTRISAKRLSSAVRAFPGASLKLLPPRAQIAVLHNALGEPHPGEGNLTSRLLLPILTESLQRLP